MSFLTNLKNDWSELDKEFLLTVGILSIIGIGICYAVARLCNC